MRKARLLAAHATTLAHIDLAEAAKGMVMAVSLGPEDSVVQNMASDLEKYVSDAYIYGWRNQQQQEGEGKGEAMLEPPRESVLYHHYMTQLQQQGTGQQVEQTEPTNYQGQQGPFFS